MKQIFADTSYWIGLVNPRDQLHQKVIKITQQLFSVRLLTTEMVLGELLNSFSDGPFRRTVAGMVQKLRNDRNVRIVPQTSEQFESALRRYKQASGKSWRDRERSCRGRVEISVVGGSLKKKKEK